MKNSNFRKTYFNPETNELRRYDPKVAPPGYVSLGYRKVAEAFTTVKSEERLDLWNSLNRGIYGFNFNYLNSKIKHKLKKIGITLQFKELPTTNGEILLKKIKDKKK